MPTANEPKAPGLDDRFCLSCGSFEVDLKTPTEIADEYGCDEDELTARFVHDGTLATECRACGFNVPSSEDGMPTLRDLVSGESWSVDWVADFDIAQVARWAAIAVLERKDFFAKGVNSQTGEEMLCLL